MAKVSGPLYSVSATGTFGGVRFMRTRRGQTFTSNTRQKRKTYSKQFIESQIHFKYLQNVLARIGRGDLIIYNEHAQSPFRLRDIRQGSFDKWNFEQRNSSKGVAKYTAGNPPHPYYGAFLSKFDPDKLFTHDVKVSSARRSTVSYRYLFHRFWRGFRSIRWHISLNSYNSLSQSYRDSMTLTERAQVIFQPYLFDPVRQFQLTASFIAWHIAAQWLITKFFFYNPKEFSIGTQLDYDPEPIEYPADTGQVKDEKYYDIPIQLPRPV